MIDDQALKDLIKLHKLPKSDVAAQPACVIVKDLAYLHSNLFMLEIPATEISLKKETFRGTPLGTADQVAAWRSWLPKEPGYVKATAVVGDELVELMGIDGETASFMSVGFYVFFKEQLDSPVFKVMTHKQPDGFLAGIGIFVDDKLVGAVGPHLP